MKTKKYVVVGVTFDNRQVVLNDFYQNYKHGSNYEIFLEKEDDNPYDENAISVKLEINNKIEKIGYISKKENLELRNLMDKIKDAKVKFIGPNCNGDLGVSILVDFED